MTATTQSLDGRHTGAAEAVRRQIERDLHDGTQQRLVSVAMSLGLADTKLPRDPQAAKRIVRQARTALAAALAELRELVEGIHPAILTERGLAAALGDLAARTTDPVHLEVEIDTRLGADVEAAAYFVASEALTNVVKHAHARETRLRAWRTNRLFVLEVTDDGIGGADPVAGSGLPGLAERVEALRGRLVVWSPAGRGTTVRAEIPAVPTTAE